MSPFGQEQLLTTVCFAARLCALPSAADDRPWDYALGDPMRCIHVAFQFEPGATTGSSSVDEVRDRRQALCEEFDRPNDQLAEQRFITLAWRTGFADVVPEHGVILGDGATGRRSGWTCP